MAVRVPRELSIRDPKFVAPLAGLQFLPPTPPGWGRRRRGQGFSFVDQDGNIVRGHERDRLLDLAVPPAWDDVWFAPIADGYLQATGIDAAGRKQYRYHDDYRALCESRKFDRIRYFGRALPALRTFIAESLDAPFQSKKLAVGAVLGLIDSALVRVGNEQSSATGHYGATTLEAAHLESEGSDNDGHMTMSYLSKGGKPRTVVIEDEQLSDILATLAEANDDRIFTYHSADGEIHEVSATDVNAAIAHVAGPSFSAKDFRTWGGSRQALEGRVEGLGRTESVDVAAEALGNTRAVARSSYVHPTVLASSTTDIETAWKSSRRSTTMSRGDRALVKLLKP